MQTPFKIIDQQRNTWCAQWLLKLWFVFCSNRRWQNPTFRGWTFAVGRRWWVEQDGGCTPTKYTAETHSYAVIPEKCGNWQSPCARANNRLYSVTSSWFSCPLFSPVSKFYSPGTLRLRRLFDFFKKNPFHHFHVLQCLRIRSSNLLLLALEIRSRLHTMLIRRG